MKAATPNNAFKRQAVFISIHAAREGGDDIQGFAVYRIGISIHAAREGGDRKHLFKNSRRWRISIHAAREGGDGFGINASAIILYFNPRRP